MDIRVSGHQVDTGEALQAHVETRLGTIVDKYFSRAISSHVTFGHAPHGAFRCDIVCHVMSGLILKGASEAQDARQSFDQAAERIDKQLRRYMRRLKDRHEKTAAAEDGRANGVAIEDASYTVFQVSEQDGDLRNNNALRFVSRGTAAFNRVYRRNDGTIGWVEPPR